MQDRAWDALTAELDAWAEAGRRASFWWRDDDATEPTPALDRLFEMSAETGAPVALAVVPAAMSRSLPARLAAAPAACAVQHGYAHVDHAPKGAGAWELGAHRPAATILAELARGHEILSAAFAGRFLPVLVPPWTHIDAALVPRLPEAGFRGLSDFGARRARSPAPGLIQVNAHCDPIKWKGGARFTGAERALDDVVRHLVRRRLGEADAEEPTGLLTHHLEMDAATWALVAELLARVCAHPAAAWVHIGDMLTADAGAQA